MKSLQYNINHPFYDILKVFEDFEKTPMMISFNKKQKREERKKKINRILKDEKNNEN
jgi:hypothetical protein